MFLEATRYQSYVTGPFLILFSRVPGKEIRALVRHVSYKQCGQFMMGRTKAVLMHFRKSSTEFKIPLSGMYGADGLTRDPDEIVTDGHNIWNYLLQVPSDISTKFWKEESGHGELLRKWALGHRDELRYLKHRRYCTECGHACKEFFKIQPDTWKKVYGSDYPAVHTECLDRKMTTMLGRGLTLADFVDDGVLKFVHDLGAKNESQW